MTEYPGPIGDALNLRAARRRFRPAIFASDVRQIGGIVSVHHQRDRVDGSSRWIVDHVSRGGDCRWQSLPITDEDHAAAAARILAEFLGGVVR